MAVGVSAWPGAFLAALGGLDQHPDPSPHPSLPANTCTQLPLEPQQTSTQPSASIRHHSPSHWCCPVRVQEHRHLRRYQGSTQS